MYSLLSCDLAHQVQRERRAEAARTAVRHLSRRRGRRRAEEATYRARLARLAVR